MHKRLSKPTAVQLKCILKLLHKIEIVKKVYEKECCSW